MTVINTNVASLIAQTNLARANDSLNTALTRLSTGLRINSGADDPAGLIASQDLQSDIIGVNAGISNSQQANSLIATADSALGQVSTLLDNIRGLVSQSANTGALSQAQIAANQLQVDSSLQAIDQIANSTSFGGQQLLNGSLNFITTAAGTQTAAATGTVGSQAAATATATVGTGTSAVTVTATTAGTAANGYDVQIHGSTSGEPRRRGHERGLQRCQLGRIHRYRGLVARRHRGSSRDGHQRQCRGGSSLYGRGRRGQRRHRDFRLDLGRADSNQVTLTAVTGGTAYNNTTVTLVSGAGHNGRQRNGRLHGRHQYADDRHRQRSQHGRGYHQCDQRIQRQYDLHRLRGGPASRRPARIRT